MMTLSSVRALLGGMLAAWRGAELSVARCVRLSLSASVLPVLWCFGASIVQREERDDACVLVVPEAALRASDG